MSTKAVAWALEQYVGDSTAKLALIGVAEHASRETWVSWPSKPTVAVYAEVDPRHVRRLLIKLLDTELVEEAYVDELPPDERRRYEMIPLNRRPRLWRLLGPGVAALRGDMGVTPGETDDDVPTEDRCNDSADRPSSTSPEPWGDTHVTPTDEEPGVTSGVTSKNLGVTSGPPWGDINPGSGVTCDVTQRVNLKPSIKTADGAPKPAPSDNAENVRQIRKTVLDVDEVA